jgi:hypothetical protein
VTSNPTIFEKAIDGGGQYDQALRESFARDASGLGVSFTIEGRPQGDSQSSGGAGWAHVRWRFFDVFHIPVSP